MVEGEKEKMAKQGNGNGFIKVVRLPDGTWDTVAEVITLTEAGYNMLLEKDAFNTAEMLEIETVGDSKYI